MGAFGEIAITLNCNDERAISVGLLKRTFTFFRFYICKG
jgi:hypothetical protein